MKKKRDFNIDSTLDWNNYIQKNMPQKDAVNLVATIDGCLSGLAKQVSGDCKFPVLGKVSYALMQMATLVDKPVSFDLITTRQQDSKELINTDVAFRCFLSEWAASSLRFNSGNEIGDSVNSMLGYIAIIASHLDLDFKEEMYSHVKDQRKNRTASKKHCD